MKNIFQETVESVYDGAKFYINFEQRILKVDGRCIIKNGQFDGELGIKPTTKDKMFRTIEKFFRKYQYSRPSERSDSRGRLYFRPIPTGKLPEEAIWFGIPRELAQVRLELYILCCILNGTFTWDSTNYFWTPEDKRYPELVILRKWVEGSATSNSQKD